MSSLLQRMKSVGSIKSMTLNESTFFDKKDVIPTDLHILNIAFSGEVDGGITPGLTVLAGESKSFKTLLGLYCMKAYMDKYKDAVCLFYDTEFGVTPEYVRSNGIDGDRVIHIPIEYIEQMKFDLAKRLDEIKRGDKVFIFVDSLGLCPSKKEIDDAIDEKSVADMTRAKAIRSLFRIVTPQLTTKDLPCVVINHIYKCGTKEMMVITENGSKSLKDIVVGDIVLTTNGYEAVTFTTSYEDTPVTDIELEDGTVLSFTSGHRFMVNGKWVYVHDLKPGMILDKI